MRSYPSLIQDEQKACGVFCIAMILQYYGYKEEIKEIKKRTRLNKEGVSIYGMVECLRSYNIETNAYEASLDILKQSFQKPCILFMENEGIGHYVVLYEIKDHCYIVGDPALGLVTYDDEKMSHYTSRCIMIHHVGNVATKTRKTYISFLKTLFFTYRSTIKSIIKKGLFISLLGYMSTLFFKWLIDYIHNDSSFFIVGSGIVAYILCEIMKTLFHYFKAMNMSEFQIWLDEDLLSESVLKLIDRDLDCDNDVGYKQSELLSLFDLSEMSSQLIENIIIDGLCMIIFFIGMFFVNAYMTMIVVIMLSCMIIMSSYMLKIVKKRQKAHIESYYSYCSYLMNFIKSLRFAQLHHLHNSYTEQYNEHFYQLSKHKKETQESVHLLYLYNQLIIYLFYMIILFIGLSLYSSSAMSLGYVFMFYMLMTYCISPMMNHIAMFGQYQHMSILYEKYKKYNDDQDYKELKECESIKTITFDHIEYSYGYGVPVIKHLDWEINGSVLLKGESGCGKSTLLLLLLGYDENYRGDIFINDIELRQLSKESLFQRLSYLDETPVFIEDTLFHNFLCDDYELIVSMLKRLKQDVLIDMFDSCLDIEGSMLSLGQRQSVAFVREILSSKDVYIFDEAFSHMDENLLKSVYEYLCDTKDECIYIIVNHQINLMNIDFDCVIMSEKRISKG